MKANLAIIVPETHWDREWYLPFQEYRARLVILMDKLLNILETDPNYTNFTLDGQTIPIEDYLEVRPDKEEIIKKFVRERRLSIGPLYNLPDEFLISGESFIRNYLIGYKFAEKLGGVMKAGYNPDAFGHIAQLPQLLAGFELNSSIFWRGFGNEIEEENLNMEFIWNAPGNAASIIAIRLVLGYGSLASLDTSIKDGVYKKALKKIKSTIKFLEEHTTTPVILLNNGVDHTEAQAELPKIIQQWNTTNPDCLIEQNDFEYYIKKVLSYNPNLNSYQGEFRSGKYSHLLAGVLSSRMWIKQKNTEIEYLFEKYTEPISTITWALDKYTDFEYPRDYILTGLKWVLKNHPHDSICGCSIDQVHEEMKTRFDWAEQIGYEIFKNSMLYLVDLIHIPETKKKENVFLVYNPLPWSRHDVVSFNGIIPIKDEKRGFPNNIKIYDDNDNEIEFVTEKVEEEPRFTQEINTSYKFTLLAEVPPCGYRIYKIVKEKMQVQSQVSEEKQLQNSIENEFYKISVDNSGIISCVDKTDNKVYEKICFIEDSGDWGDEYDYSGPKGNQTDTTFSTLDAVITKISCSNKDQIKKTLSISMILKLPISLTSDRLSREEVTQDNYIKVNISLFKGIKRIDFSIEYNNTSRDHRLRVIFPSYIKAQTVFADGHFYVVPRKINLPDGENWTQKPVPTNHQKDFVSICGQNHCFAVLNKGLPEYEAIENEDGTINLAITLLRSIGWLSRDDFESRSAIAGPDLSTPGAQCLGNHTFNLSLIIESDKKDLLAAEIHVKGKEFNVPLIPFFPSMARTPLRVHDKIIFKSIGLLSIFMREHKQSYEPILPSTFSFLEVDNKNIILSILKKAESSNNLILRIYNISPNSQTGKILFNPFIEISDVQIVNLLEETPKNPIKASAQLETTNVIVITLEPHVICTLKINMGI
jgi:mannosylglycerate hydrolase